MASLAPFPKKHERLRAKVKLEATASPESLRLDGAENPLLWRLQTFAHAPMFPGLNRSLNLLLIRLRLLAEGPAPK
jgi:hypothetical protein